MASYFYSPIKQKILLLLASGIALGFSNSPRLHHKILKSIPKAFRDINRSVLRRTINEFKYKRLVDFSENKDGTVTITLTVLGRKQALRYNPDNISIQNPPHWDKKWRVIVFDIPEKKRRARDALRFEMKKLGFFELQRSVWVYPHDCRDAIDFLVEFFEVRNYVRYLVVSEMSYDADLKVHFNLQNIVV